MTKGTKSPAKMSKPELIEALTNCGYTGEQLCDSNGYRLKRPALITKLQEHLQGENGLEVLAQIPEEIDDTGVEVNSMLPDAKEEKGGTKIQDFSNRVSDTKIETDEEHDPPTPRDPEWTQYVLGKFLPDEVDGQNPRVEGLRRVASELVGELIEEGCDLIAVPTEENRFRACAKAWGVFVTPEGIQKRFEALADAHGDNCFEDYATYLVAMADTRAKGRMYRNALCLRRVVSAEEVSKTMAMVSDVQPGGKIHAGQITMLRMISERHDFSITEVLDTLGIKHELNEQTGDVNLQSLSYEDALMAVTHMRKEREIKKDG